MNKRPALN